MRERERGHWPSYYFQSRLFHLINVRGGHSGGGTSGVATVGGGTSGMPTRGGGRQGWPQGGGASGVTILRVGKRGVRDK